MIDWVQRVAAIIRGNLRWSPLTEKQKQSVVEDFISEMENPPAPVETKAQPEEEDDPITMKGEKLSTLRARARKEWEPWLQK
jgi:hypothetical protein